MLRREIGGRTLVVGATERDDGDMHPGRVAAESLRRRQLALTTSTWVMLEQRHGTGVHTVSPSTSSWPIAGTGDVVVASVDDDDALAVWAADCAPLALFGQRGRRVLAHAGWRGLAAGVVDIAADAADDTVAAVLGPCIHPCCYEFGVDAIEQVHRSVELDDAVVRATTSDGALALDVPGIVAAILERRGIVLDVVGPCTGCDPRFFSHRCGVDLERHALVTWIEGTS